MTTGPTPVTLETSVIQICSFHTETQILTSQPRFWECAGVSAQEVYDSARPLITRSLSDEDPWTVDRELGVSKTQYGQ